MAQITRRIREHRPVLIFTGLVLASLLSIASGTQGGPIATGIGSVAATATRPFLQVMNAAQGGVTYVSSIVLEHEALIEQNEAYGRTFQVMLQHTAERNEFAAENRRLRKMLAFERENPQYSFMPAKVLQHSQGLLTIDRGTLHGLRDSLCVVTVEGVIGIIVRADWMTSIVATLQDTQCRVDAMVERTRVRGTVHGSTSDLSNICELRYVEIKHEIRAGDRIVTSPDSVFPTGYPIGVIDTVEYDPGSMWKSAGISPAANPYSVDEVLIVLRADTTWAELASAPAEEPLAATFADDRSVQERYAP